MTPAEILLSGGSAVLPSVGLERAYLIPDYCPSEMEPRASQLCTHFDACVCTGAATGAAAICSTHHVRAILQDRRCHSTGCLELLFPIKCMELFPSLGSQIYQQGGVLALVCQAGSAEEHRGRQPCENAPLQPGNKRQSTSSEEKSG